jgi:predicted transposase/invertase (TIGR01784 family)
MSTTHPYFDPKNDMLFKRVFGEHENLLRSFLNAMLPLADNAPIVSLEYLSPEQVPEVPGLFKNSIVDVKCKDAGGRIFIVEMQMLWSPSFDKRIVFGASQAYVKQIKPSVNYTELQPVYALALINGVFDHQTDEFYHHYEILNQDNPTEKLRGLEFVLVELPKFKPESRIEKRAQIKWLKYLSQIDERTQTVDPELAQDPEIASALEMVKVAALSAADIELYHEREDKARIEATVIEDAKAEGLAKGLATGLAQGLATGLAQGEASGKRAAAIEIAKNLLAAGMTAADVAAATQLSVDEVERATKSNSDT